MKINAQSIYLALIGREVESKAAAALLSDEIDLVTEVKQQLRYAAQHAIGTDRGAEGIAEYEACLAAIADADQLTELVEEVKTLAHDALPASVTITVADLERVWGHSAQEWGVLGGEPSGEDEVIFRLREDETYSWEIGGVTQEDTHPATEVLSW